MLHHNARHEHIIASSTRTQEFALTNSEQSHSWPTRINKWVVYFPLAHICRCATQYDRDASTVASSLADLRELYLMNTSKYPVHDVRHINCCDITLFQNRRKNLWLLKNVANEVCMCVSYCGRVWLLEVLRVCRANCAFG